MGIRKMFILAVLIGSCSGLAACSSGSNPSVPLSVAAPGDNGGPVVPGDPGSGSGAGTSGTGSAVLSWAAPTTNTDGSAITDLAGYKVSYGAASGTYTKSVDVGKATTYDATGLGTGTWYFVVTAYNSAGGESDNSNEMSKTVQ